DLDFSAPGQLDATVTLDFSFGVDLNDLANGAALPDAFFIRDATLSGDLHLSAEHVNASARFGFLSIQIVDGSVVANPSFQIALTDPNTRGADGRIDLSEFADLLSNLDSLVSTEFTGSAQMSLPISAPFLGITPSADTTIGVSIPDFGNLSTATV